MAVQPSPNKVAIAMQSNNVLRGKLMLILHKILVSPSKYWEIIGGRILPNTYWPEVALITAMVNAIPISRWIYDKRKGGELEEDVIEANWKMSKSLQFARVLRQVGLLQAILYVSDVFLVVLKLLDFKFVVKYQAAQVAGSVIFSSWLAYNLSRIKYHYLIRNNGSGNFFSLASIRRRKRKQKQTQQDDNTVETETGQPTVGVYNRFANRVLDVIIYMSAILSVVDLLGIHVGFALKSIFGLGSFGTLVLSLASKDLAAEFVGGLMVQSSNFIDEGETVILQDGTKGNVAKIGWLVSNTCSYNWYYGLRECFVSFSPRWMRSSVLPITQKKLTSNNLFLSLSPTHSDR